MPSGFNQPVEAHHPLIWRFIEGLKKEQSLNELMSNTLLVKLIRKDEENIETLQIALKE